MLSKWCTVFSLNSESNKASSITATTATDKSMEILPWQKLLLGSKLNWPIWRTLNSLCIQTAKCDTNMYKWGYRTAPNLCYCEQQQTMSHLVICPNLDKKYSMEDLSQVSPAAVKCTPHWSTVICSTQYNRGSLISGIHCSKWSNNCQTPSFIYIFHSVIYGSYFNLYTFCFTYFYHLC